MQPIGVVGLGLMGSVLVRRLLDAGFAVAAHDVDAAKLRTAEAAGARPMPAGDMAGCRCLVLALFDTPQVEQVVEALVPPATVVCTSTCDPDRIAALAHRAAGRGIRFLEAPISGTSEQVRQGQGVALLGGDPALAAELDDVLRALFAVRHQVGRIGDGGRAKLAVNLVLGLNRLALAEGLVFAERLGLDPAAFLSVAQGSAAASQVMGTKGPKMVAGDFTPQGKARQTLKDFRLMLDQAATAGQALPLAELNTTILSACVAAGEGDLDNSVVIQEVRRRGVRLSPAAPAPDAAPGRTGPAPSQSPAALP